MVGRLLVGWAVVLGMVLGTAPAQEAKPAAKKAGTAKKAATKKAPAKKKAEPAPVEKPIWTYRPHYVFTGDTLQLDMAQDNGEWRLRAGEGESLADPIGFEIELAGGKRLGNEQMQAAATERGPNEDVLLGAGTVYETIFAPVDGLKVTQRVMKYKERPFLTIRFVLENTGAEPAKIARVAPMVLAPGVFKGFPATVEKHAHFVDTYAGFAIPETGHTPIMWRLFDPARKACLLVGMLPTGQGDTRCELKHDGTAWTGVAEYTYSPALVVAPGAKVTTDAVCIGFNSHTSEATDSFYNWALGTGLRKQTVVKGPTAWVTTAPGGSVDELKDAASAWSKRGVKHALARSGTKGNFGQLAKELKKGGVRLGVELDPMDADGAEGAWVIAGAEGRRWLNPTAPEAQAFLKDRVEKLVRAECAFIVLGETAAPAEVFEQIGLPREEAIDLAADAIAAAAPNTYLHGAPGTPMAADPAVLAKAADDLKALVQFGAWPPVIELAVNGDAKAQFDAARAAWPYVIEVVGKP